MIVGIIEKENRRLIAESLEFQDSQICGLVEKSDKDRCNQTRTLVADMAEDLLAQQRRLFERGFKDTEQLACILVLALDDVTTLASPLLWERIRTDISLIELILTGRPEGY